MQRHGCRKLFFSSVGERGEANLGNKKKTKPHSSHFQSADLPTSWSHLPKHGLPENFRNAPFKRGNILLKNSSSNGVGAFVDSAPFFLRFRRHCAAAYTLSSLKLAMYIAQRTNRS